MTFLVMVEDKYYFFCGLCFFTFFHGSFQRFKNSVDSLHTSAITHQNNRTIILLLPITVHINHCDKLLLLTTFYVIVLLGFLNVGKDGTS